MDFSIGIIGLPNVGKSTLFKALTKKAIALGPYPFTTINPNTGVVKVPDERLEEIAKVVRPERVIPTVIEFIDIAGLVKDSHKGEGLGNQFLAQIRNCDAILEVIRGFRNEKVENVLGEVDPKKEIETIKTELLMKDLETLEKTLSKAEFYGSETKQKKKALLSSHIENDLKKDKKIEEKFERAKKIKEEVSRGKLIGELNLEKEEILEIKEYQFLTQKPIFHLLNINGKTFIELDIPHLKMNLKEEEEISELSEEEAKELGLKSHLDQIIKTGYKILDLITFYTIKGGKEVRAWTLKRGLTAPDAGGVVHTDFKEKFIRAQVINWKELVKLGSWAKAKEKGLLKIVGHNYILEDGDIIEFKI